MPAPGEDADGWMRRAALLQRRQDLIGADLAIARARALAPADARIAFLHAQTRYELGFPAAALFAEAVALDPANRDARRNHALALASEGQGARAEALLADALAAAPDWLDGQRVLASLRWTLGDADEFDHGFAEGCAAQPGNRALWLGWFGAVAQQRDWPRARAILASAEAALGATLPAARLFVATETRDDETARALLAELARSDDPFVAIAGIRFLLRTGDPRGAVATALPLLRTPLAGQAWPYLSTAWRLLGDPRAAWLDGDPLHAATLDLDIPASELTDLAGLLRSLHTAREGYAEQSVRGGTQTDRSVLLRHEPLLQRTRARLMDAVRGFVATLPPVDPSHPLLGRPRGELRIAGSWSVRLGPGGHNVVHSHPLGWISSAFYVALPAAEIAPAGHLELGAPPAELGLDLPPYRTIAPAPGRLALFASTLWHGTVPFAAGERLNLAFDVVPASA